MEVSLQRGVADVRLRAGNSLTLARLRQIVKSNGFSPRDAVVSVIGQLVRRDGAPALNVAGTDTVVLVVKDPARAGAFDQAIAGLAAGRGKAVTLEGTVRPSSDPRQPDELVLRSLGSGPR